MTRPFLTQFPGRRRLLGAGIALNTALISALMLVGGATPAAAAGTHTVTAWVPLACMIASAIPTEVGTAVTATIPDSVTPGEVFNLTGNSTVQVFPPASQDAGAATFHNADQIDGTVSDFEMRITDSADVYGQATTAFVGAGTPTQINQVAAAQAPNQAFVDPLIIGGAPIGAGVSPPKTFAFGHIPNNPIPPALATSYGPAPGTGGGPLPTSGSVHPVPTFGPFTTTGAAGTDIVLRVGDPTHTFLFGIGSPVPLSFAASTRVFFHGTTAPAIGVWQGPVPTDCGVDTTAGALPSPDPTFVSTIVIPIVPALVVPEAPFAVMLPLVGLLVIGTMLVYRRRRNIDRRAGVG